MKKAKRIIFKILGTVLCVLSSVTIITFLSNGELTNDIGFCIFLFILLVISIILLFLGKKTKAEKKQK